MLARCRGRWRRHRQGRRWKRWLRLRRAGRRRWRRGYGGRSRGRRRWWHRKRRRGQRRCRLLRCGRRRRWWRRRRCLYRLWLRRLFRLRRWRGSWCRRGCRYRCGRRCLHRFGSIAIKHHRDSRLLWHLRRADERNADKQHHDDDDVNRSRDQRTAAQPGTHALASATQMIGGVNDSLQHALPFQPGFERAGAGGAGGLPRGTAGCSANSATLVKPPWVIVPITSMIRPYARSLSPRTKIRRS